MHDLVIKNGLLVYPHGTVHGDCAVADGKIVEIGAAGTLQADRVIDASDRYVLPGIIDPHVHPVYMDKIGDCSRTAAFGGVTTMMHYAYARPGNSLCEKIEEFRHEGLGASCTDFALHGGLFETMKQADEIPRAFEMGVTSFKVFMSYAKLGWMTDDYAMCKVMDRVGKLGGLVAVHAETGLAIDYIQDQLLEEKADFAERFLETSPDLAEAEGIFRCVSIGRMMNCPVYIPHISSSRGIEAAKYLKSQGYKMYAETCPQYLTLTWDELKKKGPLGKVGPSIKTDHDRTVLWNSIHDGHFDTIGSDHAPKDKKESDDFFDAPYGSPEIETMLPMIWHFGVNSGLITPSVLVRIMSENVARVFGLFPEKGGLYQGSDADIVIFNPFETWTVSQDNQHSNASYTLFEGKEITGRVEKVLSRGDIIVDGDDFQGKGGRARFLPTRAGRF